jgi:hypothetical protein
MIHAIVINRAAVPLPAALITLFYLIVRGNGLLDWE